MVSGCASRSAVTANQDFPVYWNKFPGARLISVESPEDIMHVSDEAHAFIQSVKAEWSNDPRDRLDNFIEAIFQHGQQGIDYFTDANYSVSDTFFLRRANCLSLTLMAYALAKEAGFSASLNVVEIPEYWSRKQGYSILNGHINVTITDVHMGKAINSRVVDFDRRMVSQKFDSKIIQLNDVIAMYYNNKAAMAIIEGAHEVGFAYLAKSLEVQPLLDQAWVNLGVLYRMNNKYDAAEESYLRAIHNVPDDLTAKENLAVLYRYQGKFVHAAALEDEVRRQRESNPYYHLILGDEAYDRGRINEAHTHYRRAYRLDRQNHLVLSALSKTAYMRGLLEDAEQYLQRAKNHARQDVDRERYTAKLAVLSGITTLQDDY